MEQQGSSQPRAEIYDCTTLNRIKLADESFSCFLPVPSTHHYKLLSPRSLALLIALFNEHAIHSRQADPDSNKHLHNNYETLHSLSLSSPLSSRHSHSRNLIKDDELRVPSIISPFSTNTIPASRNKERAARREMTKFGAKD